MKLKIEKIDHVFVRVLSEDEGILYELSEFFTYEYPGARFTPQYRAKLWDGKVRMYDIMRKTLYVGLVKYVESFALERGYELEYVNQVITHTNVDIDTVSKFAEWLTPMGHGKPIEIRDYQLEAVHKAIHNERTLLLSPTASGKSFIIYTTMRWHLNENRKQIIIVPTTS